MNLFTVSPLSTALLVRPNIFSDIQRKTTSQHPLPTSSYKKLGRCSQWTNVDIFCWPARCDSLVVFTSFIFFYFSRDKACSDHKKNMIRIGYIHKAYCIFLLYSFLVVVVRITVFPCRNKSVMWSFFNYFTNLITYLITVLCDTLFCVPQNRFGDCTKKWK